MARAFKTTLNETHQPKRQGPKLHLVEANIVVDVPVTHAGYEAKKVEAAEDAYLAETGRMQMQQLIAKYKSAHTSYRNMRTRCKTLTIELGSEFSTFPKFLTLMGPVPNKGDTLDRIKIDGPYTLDNVRWADKQIQARNRSNVRTLTVNGQTRLLVEWAELTNQPKERLHMRLARGWTDEEIVTGDRTRALTPKLGRVGAGSRFEALLQKLPWPQGEQERWEKEYQRNGHQKSRIEFGIDYCLMTLRRVSEATEELPPDFGDYREQDHKLSSRADEVDRKCVNALKHFRTPGLARFHAMEGRLTKTEKDQLNKTFGPHVAE